MRTNNARPQTRPRATVATAMIVAVLTIGAMLVSGAAAGADVGTAEQAQSADIFGQITNTDGASFTEAKIDLFAANGDGTKGAYLRSTTPSTSFPPVVGAYQFPGVEPGCYVLVFVLEENVNKFRWSDSRSLWSEERVCVANGAERGVSRKVYSAKVSFRVVGDIDRGAKIDVFLGNYRPDGSVDKGDWLYGVSPDRRSGNYFIEEVIGCYVLTYIAPSGRVWAATNSKWSEIAVCRNTSDTITHSPGLR